MVDLDKANHTSYEQQIEVSAERIATATGERMRGLIRSGIISPVTGAVVTYAANEMFDWVNTKITQIQKNPDIISGHGDDKLRGNSADDVLEGEPTKKDTKALPLVKLQSSPPLLIQADQGTTIIGFVDNTELLPEVKELRQKIAELKQQIPNLAHRNDRIHAEKKLMIYQEMIDRHKAYASKGILDKNFEGFAQRHQNSFFLRKGADAFGLMMKSGTDSISRLSDQYLTEYKADSLAVLSMAKDKGIKSAKNMIGEDNIKALAPIGQKARNIWHAVDKNLPNLHPGEKELATWIGGGIGGKALSTSLTLAKQGGSVIATKATNRIEEIFASKRVSTKAEIQNAKIEPGFMGRSGFELKNTSNQPLRNYSQKVNGIEYSGHALDQMQNRGITPSIVEQAIQKGKIFETKQGTMGFYDEANKIKVIINEETKKVVTVIRGKSK